MFLPVSSLWVQDVAVIVHLVFSSHGILLWPCVLYEGCEDRKSTQGLPNNSEVENSELFFQMYTAHFRLTSQS